MVSGVMTLVLAALVLLATRGSMLLLALAVTAAGYAMVLAILGTERTGILTVAIAFGTAPVYKGLASSPDAQVTPTDLLFVVGFALLLPTVINNRLRLPVIYVVGMGIVLVTGAIGSLLSKEMVGSFLALTLWLMVMGGLPTFMAWWSPAPRVVELLLWAYVAGHMVSTAVALKDGPTVQGRYGGLATHFNYFAQAGMLSFAILLYLFFRYRHRLVRSIALGAAVVSVYSVHLSGSRAATAVLAVLILMIPIVERSAVLGFFLALLGALVVIAAPLIVDIAGETSALGRLAGGGGSQYSDQARELGQRDGISRFWDHPLTGSGLIDLFDIHNNYLEVAVGIGLFGLLGYILVLFALARPLFSDDEHRRLAYTVWAYIGFGATIPSLYDRGIWAPVSLTVLVALSWWTTTDRREADDGPADVAPSTPAMTREAIPPR